MDSRFYDLARSTLDAVVAGWPTDPDVAVPLPERRYVGFGLMAWDCEQFTVSGTRAYSIDGDVAAEQIISTPVFYNRAYEMQLSIIRCVPDIDTSGDVIIEPTPTDIEVSAQAAFADQQTLTDVLIAAQEARQLAAFSGLAFGNWTAEGPQGGFGGGTLGVRLVGF